jgi:hypothetical protein
MPKNTATENKLTDTPGNIFNPDKSGIQANNKPESVITEKSFRMFTFYHREERVNILVLQRQHAVALQTNFCPCSNIQGYLQETGVR